MCGVCGIYHALITAGGMTRKLDDKIVENSSSGPNNSCLRCALFSLKNSSKN